MDPEFYKDTEFYDEDLEKDLDEKCNDWDEDFFREVEDFEKFEHDVEELLYPDQLNADQIGLALAFGDLVTKDREAYGVDENTDKENWESAMKLYPLQSRYNSTRNLSGFEKYIDGITSGRTEGPWR